MQLQRSLFTFYRVFARKTPLIVWVAFALAFLVIIGWEVDNLYTAKSVYKFDKCMMQFFNATRTIENDTKRQAPQQNPIAPNNAINNTDNASQQQNKKPFFLQPSYYNFLNETSTIKVYLSDQIDYKEDEPNCQIILNTQKLRPNQEKQNNLTPQEKKGDNQPEKQVKLLQQIQIEQTKQPQQNKDKQPQQNAQSKQLFSLKQRPVNIRNFDQISDQQHKFLLNEHSFMHITANQHVVYLDQNNEFQQKHKIQIHAIIVSRQQFSQYPESFFGISSKWWRFHGNENITLNGNFLRTMGETFLKVGHKVKELYKNSLDSVNLLIALKRFMNETNKKDNVTDPSNQVKDKQGNLVKQPQTSPNTTNPTQKSSTISVQPNSTHLNKKEYMQIMQQLPKQMITQQLIYPLNQLKLYFHYPQTLRIEDISRLANTVQNSDGLIYKIFTLLSLYAQLFILSALVGLLVRYVFFWIVTIYLFLGGCWLNKQWGWVQKYYMLVRNRFTPQNALGSIKMIALFVFALIGTMTVFAFGAKYIVENLYIVTLPFSEMYYAQMLIKNYFIIEMFYFVCCRTRTGLRYFPLFSLALTILILFVNYKFYCYNITWLMNFHLIVHLFLMTLFLAVENYIGNSEFHSEFTPSEDKPRALYYVGYDISWENTLPPIWTYFTTYFDLKYFGERQQVLIKKDYQMLYGRLLGMNQRQQLPEDQEDEEEDQVNKLNQNSFESNEMSLMR